MNPNTEQLIGVAVTALFSWILCATLGAIALPGIVFALFQRARGWPGTRINVALAALGLGLSLVWTVMVLVTTPSGHGTDLVLWGPDLIALAVCGAWLALALRAYGARS